MTGKENERKEKLSPDEIFMKRAFSLALRGEGRVSPNPLVGAVLVRNGRIVGEGYHRRYGGKHAEAEAIAAASEPPQGCDLYCTLEPCCFSGPEKHQPPCTDLIIRSGIARVIIANRDPNPKVDGGGIRRLREAGIEVSAGILEAEGERINEAFFTAMRLRRPFIHLKAAQSLDGRLAAASGDSKWITDIEARREAHRLRGKYDAVLTGIGTVLTDDPELTVRHVRGKDPRRIVLDSSLSLPETAKVLRPGNPPRGDAGKNPAGLLVFCAEPASPEKKAALEARSAKVVAVRLRDDGGLDLRDVLKELDALKIRSVLVEGGPRILTSFLRAGLWDKATFFIAPIVLGASPAGIGNLGVEFVAEAPRLARVKMKKLGDQVMLTGYRQPKGE